MHQAVEQPEASTCLTRVRGPLPLLGPAFVASVAYVDPGNFATNITAGSTYGYLLVWVVVVANVMAMLIQYLAAKAGIATGESLPALCREQFPKPVSRALWLQAEVVAIATDVAEVLGGALALYLLFGTPLLAGGVITAVVSLGILGLQRRGHRPFEIVITAMLVVILVGFSYGLVTGGVDTGALINGTVPRLAGEESLLLAAGMLGATVMPHAIWLHGALTQGRYIRRTPEQRAALLRSQRVDVVTAMTIAGLVNLAMLVIAAQVLSDGPEPVDTIEGAHAGLGAALGPAAALLFALALLASGFAATSVGTYSGQVVMEGFLRRRVPLLLRRLITVVPALVVLALGVDPTRALVLSQVVLSFGVPFALVPLVLLTRQRTLMGQLANRPVTTAVASVVAGLIISLNVVLIASVVTG
ncbi:MAG: Manganese transport protein MntH [uncultured Nocardioidaceae bacterium]|uniref:Divalent metal cation transporter MntH n=1 Tax=uncultured Nocardioidaceae bacterium TaxID=253824 RepID=A0A6J4M3Q0_9ACTN|nr:MAG: Manganese transport protein MntH [uncultured Nocardioidaceae bacterium]